MCSRCGDPKICCDGENGRKYCAKHCRCILCGCNDRNKERLRKRVDAYLRARKSKKDTNSLPEVFDVTD